MLPIHRWVNLASELLKKSYSLHRSHYWGSFIRACTAVFYLEPCMQLKKVLQYIALPEQISTFYDQSTIWRWIYMYIYMCLWNLLHLHTSAQPTPRCLPHTKTLMFGHFAIVGWDLLLQPRPVVKLYIYIYMYTYSRSIDKQPSLHVLFQYKVYCA